MKAEEIAQIVDAACEGSASYFEIGGRLNDVARVQAEGEEAVNRRLGALVSAFSYDLAELGSERRDDYGPFVPMFETATYAFPPRLNDVDSDMAAVWSEVQPLVHHPAARARLSDLLWTRRVGEKPYLAAREAVSAYRETAAEWAELDKGEALTRSLELAQQINDVAGADESAALIVDAAEAAIAESDQKPGVSLRLVEALMTMATPPDEVDALLEAAQARYAANVHVQDSIADMCALRAASDSERVGVIRRAQLQRWYDFAATCEPLVAMHHLQHGVELANSFGMADEQARFRKALQDLDPGEMDFKRIQVEAPVDREVVEAYVESYVQASWSESLRMLGALGPPTGDRAQNEQMLSELMQNSLASIFPHTLLGAENTIIARSHNKDERLAYELAQHEQRAILFWSRLWIEGLRRIADRHGPPSHEELVAHFGGGAIPPVLAESFARALEAYLDERYDECSLVLAVRIEAAIRDLARSAGLVVTRLPEGGTPGGVRSLGSILQSLESRFAEESWWRYLWTALAEPLGLNLRNRLAHGLHEGNQTTAVILLQIACFLCVLRAGEPPQEAAA